MFGRIFGRGKDDPDQAVCAQCGRTLLAGEWTQTVVDADGRERVICSLCGQTRALGGDEPLRVAPAPANGGRVRESRTERDARSESDAFWKAIKEKEAEIERLQAQLARAEAEKQELAGRFAHLGTQGADEDAPEAAFAGAEGAFAGPEHGPYNQRGDSSEPGERTWGETPAEFAAELAALREQSGPVAGPPAAPPEAETETEPSQTGAAPPQPDIPAIVFEDTQPIPALGEEYVAAGAAGRPTAAGAELPGEPEDTLTPEPKPATAIPAPAAAPGATGPESHSPEAELEPVQTAADLEAEAASLTLLQRGVDLLNVSRVPHKIAETNEQLGLPSVHIGFDGQTVVATFMWSMGWYRFHVDIQSGDVVMKDRGYEELPELRPNAGVRADGTVQLAPAQISRAAMARPPAARAPEPQAEPAAAQPAAQPESPSSAAQKPPEILSKSLLGQRSDDEPASWEHTQARDFDWDR